LPGAIIARAGLRGRVEGWKLDPSKENLEIMAEGLRDCGVLVPQAGDA
jgi:hypothetical protein